MPTRTPASPSATRDSSATSSGAAQLARDDHRPSAAKQSRAALSAMANAVRVGDHLLERLGAAVRERALEEVAT